MYTFKNFFDDVKQAASMIWGGFSGALKSAVKLLLAPFSKQ